MISEPPVDAGAVHERLIEPEPDVVVILVGGPGATAGVTAANDDTGDVPAAFVVFTVKLYVVPTIKFITVLVTDVLAAILLVIVIAPLVEFVEPIVNDLDPVSVIV